MSLFSSKKFLIPLVSITSIGAVGIGTGVYYGINNNSNDIKPNEDTSKPTENNPSSNNPFIPNIELVDLQKLKDQINKESFDIHPLEANSGVNNNKVDLTKTINKNEVFAFNLLEEQITIKSSIDIPKSVSLNIMFDEMKNTVTELNNGKLHIKVGLNQTGNTSQIFDVELDGFKTPDEALTKLLDSKDKSLLMINPKDGMEKESYTTIEQLNSKSEIKLEPKVLRMAGEGNSVQEENEQTIKVSGLTTWLRNDQMKMADSKSVQIFGEVKLEKIEVDNMKTYFYLTSANKNNPLRLVARQGNKISNQALIGTIKTTNLLASQISIVPVNTNESINRTYVDLLKNTSDKKGYISSNLLNKELSVDLNAKDELEEKRMQTMSNLLFINPYLLTKNPTTENKKIPVNVVISFGSGNNTKTYSTANENEAKVLQDAGFKFGIYSKKLTETKALLEAKVFRDNMLKLGDYFKTDNYTKPVAKPNSTTPPMPGFKEMEVSNMMLKNPIEVEIEATDTEDKPQTANYLMFANYSYKGLDSNMKVVYSPFISLIRVGSLMDEMTPKASRP